MSANPLTFLFIADPKTPNGQALVECMPELESKATVFVGNSLGDLPADRLADVDVLVPSLFAGGNPAVIADLWSKCPRVRWVHSMSAGVDSIVPVLNALPGGPEMPLTNAKGAFSRSLAEYSLAAMLHFNKQIPRLQQNREGKKWEKFMMNELHGQTVGFVGFGDIAQATARLCKAFGMRVTALRQSRNGSGNELADVVHFSDEDAASAKRALFSEADFVICSLPGSPHTHNFCGAAEFAAMKSSGVFISLGRGTCVDEAALTKVLNDKSIAGAALDVFAKEPLPLESPLWQCDNLLLSPHNADLTSDYMRLTWDLFMKKVADFSSPDFKGFDQLVDKEKGY